MKRWFLSTFVVLVSIGMAKADDKAEAVVKKAIDAHGGADALNKYLASKSKAKGEMSIMGTDVDFVVTVAFMLPDRFKLDFNATIMGQKVTVAQTVKGDKIKGSIKVGDMTIPMPDEEKDQVKMNLIMQDAERITPLLDKKKFTLKLADDEEVNGKKAAVVVATALAVKKEARFYFDKTTGMLVRHSHTTREMGDDGAYKDVLEDAFPSDYKKVSGVMIAHKSVVNHDGKKFMSMTISEIELLEKLDDKLFSTDD